MCCTAHGSVECAAQLMGVLSVLHSIECAAQLMGVLSVMHSSCEC